MKKVLILMMCAAIAVFTGCHKHKHNTTVDAYDFEATLKADKALVESRNPGVEIKFYEAQGLLATNLDETVGDAKLVGVKTVWMRGAAGHTTTITHAEGKFTEQPTVEDIESIWVEDQIVDIDHSVSLVDAVRKVMEANIVKPKSRAFSFRQPVWKTMPKEKYFIFGGVGGQLVQVNSMTGEVKNCEF